ncbi:glycosyl hydrolase 115 family protein [Desertivirga brevis]|uniref:glycosyl hydrolase 115 family protein n=1 Tax=Desertivirga brevis TaxID=2810310 RepID=UPI001A960BA0|nr:glycosyl hydrolase 115 family protein [Pedobacter sp. SYSU D00873]
MLRLRKTILVGLLMIAGSVKAVETDVYISFSKVAGGFPLSSDGKVPALVCSTNEWPGVMRAFKSFAQDLQKVTGTEPSWANAPEKSSKTIIIAGTIGHNALIDQLVKSKRLNVAGVVGKWESSTTQIINNPFPGVERALVIAGSDKRGTIYGIYTVSAQIGVSPWYWWADVPVAKRKDIYLTGARHILKEPAVKYRGIFLNDEAPALTGWAREKFGGLNHKFYEHVFELILRLKGNYLWPAMWGNAFNDDDKLNPVLADEYGVVMGTSHHEPMVRSQQEWKRFGKGDWNYQTNAPVLKEFWGDGIKNMGSKESIVTIAMRGDGDEPMTEGSNIALLEKIVKDQRQIIADVTGKNPSDVPQLWALYKEVQDYYDKGMRVPDDVTLLLCDDNWGNIRKLPSLKDKPRSGGYGIYYHFDYVGGPRNYKWLNTNPISKVWEQMHLAHQYGADRIWIVNVGDLKPMEFPIEFFLDYAREPEKWPAKSLQLYTEKWAAAQFGAKHAVEIADIISEYTKYNGRRKPELLSPNTYSLVNYQEFERVVQDYNTLARRAEKIEKDLPEDYRDAFFQLVLHPVLACANLNELYYTVGKNRLYANQGRSATNSLAEKAKQLFERDKVISHRYNKELAGGKWNHMMDQTHISYVSWRDPEVDVLPEVKTLVPDGRAEMGVAVEGSLKLAGSEEVTLSFDVNNRRRYIEVFNKGTAGFDFTVKTSEEWLKADVLSGKLGDERRIWLEADWNKVPTGSKKVGVTINGAGRDVTVYALVNKASAAEEGKPNFLAKASYLALEADQFSRAIPSASWQVLPGYGRTKSGIMSVPVTQPSVSLSSSSAHLQYEINLQDTGTVKMKILVSPSLDFINKGGLTYAISVDNSKPEIINIHANEGMGSWERSVADNIRPQTFKHKFTSPGKHIIKFWRIDPGVVLQRIILDSGGLKESYLGPPASSKVSELLSNTNR